MNEVISNRRIDWQKEWVTIPTTQTHRTTFHLIKRTKVGETRKSVQR